MLVQILLVQCEKVFLTRRASVVAQELTDENKCLELRPEIRIRVKPKPQLKI